MNFWLARRTLHLFSTLDALGKARITKLTDRALLILQGPDARKLLQGLITNDINELGTKEAKGEKYQRAALYTLFLSPKAKIISDAFVFTPRMIMNGKVEYAKEQFWIDVDRSAKLSIKQHLGKHLWKKNAQLIDVQAEAQPGEHTPGIYSGMKDGDIAIQPFKGVSLQTEDLSQGEDGTYTNLIFYDPRGTKFGLRIISSSESFEIVGEKQMLTVQEHSRELCLQGASPKKVYENRLPFQFNFDMLNAISLKKGCYLGQQLVSRGYLASIIRKRVFPFEFEGNLEGFKIQQQSGIKLQSGEEIGKILSIDNKIGLALINYWSIFQKKQQWPIQFTSPFRGKILPVFQEGIESYISEVKKKQKVLEQLQL